MSTSESWIDEALQKFHLRKKVIDDSRFDRFWMMIDRSRLPERMYATCCAINVQSDQGLIYEETFLQPHPVARRYILEKENRIIIYGISNPLRRARARVFVPSNETVG